jgi:NADPH-dependent 2,4-dienoyl-CoA reductase/sulfur reductase-like enzyme
MSKQTFVIVGASGASPTATMPSSMSRASARSNQVDLLRDATATSIDPHASRVTLVDGRELTFDRLLLTTGAELRRLGIPGAGPRIGQPSGDHPPALIALAIDSSQKGVIGDRRVAHRWVRRR